MTSFGKVQFKPTRLPSLDDITGLMKYTQGKWPSDYVDFLLQVNGGRPVEEAYFVFRGDSAAMIDSFCGIRTSTTLSLLWTIKNYVVSKRMPRHVLPIGYIQGDDVICINLKTGKIGLWDHEHELFCKRKDGYPDESNITSTKLTFHKFMDQISDTPTD
jgi:hypothetical protein